MDFVWVTAASIDGKLAAAGDSLAFLETMRDQEREVGDFPDKPTWVVTHDAALLDAVRVPGLFGDHPDARATFDVVACHPLAGNAVRIVWRRRPTQQAAS